VGKLPYEENRMSATAVPTEILVTPPWLRALARSDDPESEYRQIVEAREALGERHLPNAHHARQLARLGNAPPESFAAAQELDRVGLYAKSRRRMMCGAVGSQLRCLNTECGKRFWRPYSCRLRYCPRCAPKLARDLMRRYAGISALIRRERAAHPGWVIAEIMLSRPNTKSMPSAEEVKTFNKWIGRLRDIIEQQKRLPKRSVTLLWIDEFNPKGCYLHAHGLYVGPSLPPPRKKGKPGKLSEWWQKASGGAACYIHVKRVAPEKIERAFAHLAKYALKYSRFASPERAAQLERAFHRVRRLHLLGPIYGDPAIRSTKESATGATEAGSDGCPYCRSALGIEERWCPREISLKRGAADLTTLARKLFFAAGAGPARASPSVNNFVTA
jgi:hypothetical protein